MRGFYGTMGGSCARYSTLPTDILSCSRNRPPLVAARATAVAQGVLSGRSCARGEVCWIALKSGLELEECDLLFPKEEA